MAGLSQIYADTQSVTILCTGMDETFSRARYFWWQIYKGSSLIDEFGSASPPYAGEHSATFSGLEAGASDYNVLCGIYADAAHEELLAALRLYGVYTEAPEPAGNAYIYDGEWRRAAPYVYDGGWRPAAANVYDGGWRT